MAKIVIVLYREKYKCEFMREVVDFDFKSKHKISVAMGWDNNIYYSLNKALLYDDKLDFNKRLPFSGVGYDYILFIGDENACLNDDKINVLIDSNKDIISVDNKNIRLKNVDSENIIEIKNCFFDFTLVKKGVLEKLKYPWFEPIYKDTDKGVDFLGAFDSFYNRINKLGIKSYINLNVRI